MTTKMQEAQELMEKMAEELTVVEIKDVNSYFDIRLSRIGDEWFVYKMNFHTGEVRNGNEFSYQTTGGIHYLYGRGMSEGEARNLFKRTNA